jgi:hypothetical protein
MSHSSKLYHDFPSLRQNTACIYTLPARDTGTLSCVWSISSPVWQWVRFLIQSAKNKIERIYHRPIRTTKIRMLQLKACSGASVALTTKIPAALIMVVLRVWKHSRVLEKGVALWLTVVHSKICEYIMSNDMWSASSSSHSDDLL